MTLEDWLPPDYEFPENRVALLKEIVVEQRAWKWVGREKFVQHWVILANGYAVGFNENPYRGWSFPVRKIKRETA